MKKKKFQKTKSIDITFVKVKSFKINGFFEESFENDSILILKGILFGKVRFFFYLIKCDFIFLLQQTLSNQVWVSR